MSTRSRLVTFGSLGALVLAGAACAALVGGVTGEILTVVLIAAGLGGALLVVFLEIGRGEERDRARDEHARQRQRRRLSARRTIISRHRRPG